MDDDVKANDGTLVTIAVGGHEWMLNRRRVSWIVACVVILILGLIAEFQHAALAAKGWGHLSLWGKIASSFALLILGLLVAPAARGANHKRVASESVERLLEMHRSVGSVSATVFEAVVEVEGEMKLKLQTAKVELDNYQDILLQTMQNWEEVVPTVAEDVSGRWTRRQEMLESMERNAADVEN